MQNSGQDGDRGNVRYACDGSVLHHGGGDAAHGDVTRGDVARGEAHDAVQREPKFEREKGKSGEKSRRQKSKR